MIKELIAGLFKPVTEIFKAREERKAAKEAANAKLAMARSQNQQQLELNKDEYEVVATNQLDKTWKDEYATVSVISILNLIVVGGVLAAFGHPQLLEGIGIAVNALTTAGVDIGFLLEATVMAAIGLSVWKKF